MNRNALIKAIEISGSQSALARALGVKPGHIYYWLHKGKGIIPVEYILKIERATGGRVTRHDLRPDLSELFGGAIPCPPPTAANHVE